MDATNDITELIDRLRYFNAWRRGADGRQPDPAQIGRDIDAAVAILSRHANADGPISLAINKNDVVHRP